MKIVTHYWAKPIPLRRFDWTAVDDSTYGGEPFDPVGYGRTEDEAIDDLLEQLGASDDAETAAAAAAAMAHERSKRQS